MGKASARKKEKRASNERPKSLVDQLLTSAANPLVSICIYTSKANPELNMFRSMGFITERLRGNLRLVVSCRHSFLRLEAAGKGGQGCVAINNPNPTVLQVIGRPFYDPDPEADIAFMVVRDPKGAATRGFYLQPTDPPFVGETKFLYNAKATVDPIAGLYKPFIARQPVTEYASYTYCKLSDSTGHTIAHSKTAEHEKLLKDGWTRCRKFNMVSRKGFSGSPVWDDELNLYGLNVRGTAPDMANYKETGDQMVCLPTSRIYQARMALGDQIKELLSQTK